MTKSLYRFGFALGLALVAPACGDTSSMTDASASIDMRVPATTDGGMPADMAKASTVGGTLLFKGKGVQIVRISGDDEVIFFDTSMQGSSPGWASPVSTGKKEQIDPDTNYLAGSGKTVLPAEGYDDTTKLAATFFWRMGDGNPTKLADNASTQILDASKDDKYLLYTDNASGDGSEADVYVADADGKNAKMLAHLSMLDCVPYTIQRTSGWALSGCTPMGDAGVSARTIWAISGADKKATQLAMNQGEPTETATYGNDFLSLDASDDYVVYRDAMGDGYVVDNAGKAAKFDAGYRYGFFDTAGKAYYYLTKAGSLKKLDPAAPAMPTTLEASGITDYISTSDAGIVYYKGYQDMTNQSDLYFKALDAGKAPLTLVGTQDGSIYGAAFTTDLSTLLYITNADKFGVGKFVSQPIGGGKVTEYASKAWNVRAAKGTKVVYSDNYKGGMMATSDLYVVDTATGMSTLLQAGITVPGNGDDFYVSQDKSHVVFFHQGIPGKEGLYSIAIP